MCLSNTIKSLLEINGIPLQDRELLQNILNKIQETDEYSEEEYQKIMDIICKYSLC
jgi:hypothetical protein